MTATRINKPPKTQKFTAASSTTLAAGAITTVSIPITTPSGYTPVGMVGFSTGSRNISVAWADLGSDGDGKIGCRNTSNDSTTFTANINILFLPS